MAEMTNNPKTVSLLNELIVLDFDAIEAYEAAISRLNDANDKSQLTKFMDDHRRHVADLTTLVVEHGGTAAVAADIKQVLTKGKVVIAGLMGDKAILEAMKSNEDTTTKTYEKATREPVITTRVRGILERNLNDERRHWTWIDQRLAKMAGASQAGSRAPR